MIIVHQYVHLFSKALFAALSKIYEKSELSTPLKLILIIIIQPIGHKIEI